MDGETALKWLGGALTACLAAVFTVQLVAALAALLTLFWLDFLSGSLAAQAIGKPLDPTVAYEGKAGKGGWRRKTVSVILVLSVAVFQELAEYLGNLDLANVPTAVALCSGLVFVELLSVARNASVLGVDKGLLRKFFGLDGGDPPKPPPEVHLV